MSSKLLDYYNCYSDGYECEPFEYDDFYLAMTPKEFGIHIWVKQEG